MSATTAGAIFLALDGKLSIRQRIEDCNLLSLSSSDFPACVLRFCGTDPLVRKPNELGTYLCLRFLEVIVKVNKIMTANPKTCTPTSSLADAAGLMWQNDCGVVPVVAEGGKVVGLVTDRDICMAAALKDRRLSNITVEDVVSGKVFDCKPDDDIRTALKTMQDNRVHRLPVVAPDGTLEGVLSLNDIVLKAEEARDKRLPEISYDDVVTTYKSICQHRSQMRAQATAAM